MVCGRNEPFAVAHFALNHSVFEGDEMICEPVNLDNNCDVKTCPVCGIVKDFNHFSKSKSRSDGLQFRCKVCYAAYTEKYRLKSRPQLSSKTCGKCRLNFEINHFSKRSASRDGYHPLCKSCVKNYKTKYYASNREIILEKQRLLTRDPTRDKKYGKVYRTKNPGSVNAKTARRRALKENATPVWLNDIQKDQIKWFYDAAIMMDKTTGVKHHVDHIHPINGNNFVGLHVPWNLQVIPAFDNVKKKNLPPISEIDMFFLFDKALGDCHGA